MSSAVPGFDDLPERLADGLPVIAARGCPRPHPEGGAAARVAEQVDDGGGEVGVGEA